MTLQEIADWIASFVRADFMTLADAVALLNNQAGGGLTFGQACELLQGADDWTPYREWDGRWKR